MRKRELGKKTTGRRLMIFFGDEFYMDEKKRASWGRRQLGDECFLSGWIPLDEKRASWGRRQLGTEDTQPGREWSQKNTRTAGRTPAHIWQCHPPETAEAAAAAILILQLFPHWVQQLGFQRFPTIQHLLKTAQVNCIIMATLFMGRKCCYVLCLIFIFFLQRTNGVAVQVGGAVGWTNFDLATSGPPDYATWASTQSLTVGDTLVFTFAPQYHNVYSLPTEAAYGSCDQAVATQLSDGTTGSYSWAPTKGGIYYFACFKLVEGQGTHCEMGQKVALIVKDGVAAPTIAPIVAPIPAPILPPVAAPVPAPALVPISAPVLAPTPVTETPALAPASSVVPESVVGVPAPAPTPRENAGVLSSVPAWTALFLLSALVVLGI